MLDAIEIINNVIAQHQKITEVVKTTGDRMNDIDAVFSVQNSTWQVAWMTTTMPKLLEKRAPLLDTINILGDGLKKHFEYEQKVLPLVMGELLMKDILHDHDWVISQVETTQTFLTGLDGLLPEDFQSRRLDLIRNIHNLRDLVLNHARYEEIILNNTRSVFEDNISTRARLKLS
jgi:hypothetical protein